MLADPTARRREFGVETPLELPTPTLPIERLGAFIEVFLCSGLPTQLLVFQLLTYFGMTSQAADGGWAPAFIVGMALIDMVLVLLLITVFLRAHREPLSGFVLGPRRPGREGNAVATFRLAIRRCLMSTTYTASPKSAPKARTSLLGKTRRAVLAARTDNTQGNTYWAFSQANESAGGANVGHLWNYALNTWGWEDGLGGGDRDYSDLVVQLDFTSTAGSAYIA